MTLTLHFALVVLLTTAAAVVMVQLGLAKRMLSARAPVRRCPSCGRIIDGRVCSHCTRR
jgi:recombinational DNA repair protein RecR